MKESDSDIHGKLKRVEVSADFTDQVMKSIQAETAPLNQPSKKVESPQWILIGITAALSACFFLVFFFADEGDGAHQLDNVLTNFTNLVDSTYLAIGCFAVLILLSLEFIWSRITST